MQETKHNSPSGPAVNMHILEREIELNIPDQELWNFIATPENLNRLTPPELEFRVLSEIPEQMYDGLTILYEIKIPFFGRNRWLTEIKHIREGISFVDEQRLGPYSFWYHYHQVTKVAESHSRMLDRVHYRLPFGPLGSVVHHLRVNQMLDDIFAYRAQKLLEIFP